VDHNRGRPPDVSVVVCSCLENLIILTKGSRPDADTRSRGKETKQLGAHHLMRSRARMPVGASLITGESRRRLSRRRLSLACWCEGPSGTSTAPRDRALSPKQSTWLLLEPAMATFYLTSRDRGVRARTRPRAGAAASRYARRGHVRITPLRTARAQADTDPRPLQAGFNRAASRRGRQTRASARPFI
jgi:hypothetical protein